MGLASFFAAQALAALVIGYVLGSIPFGLLITRIAGLGDIRAIGSGNIGATNVLRTGHKGLALATLLLDGGKGAAAVMIAGFLLSPIAGLLAGTMAVIGHNFPVWLRFKGGKGVATTLGMMCAAVPIVGLMACVTWLVVAVLFRYSSMAALAALALAPAYAVLVGEPEAAIAFAILGVLGWVRHQANLRRLIRGEEPKIGAAEGLTMTAPDELVDWIRLIRTEGIGPINFRKHVTRFGSPAEALHHLPTFKRDLKIATPAFAETEIAAARRAGLTYITWADAAYPEALKAIEDAPPVLLVKGDPGILATASVAVVGARNASVNGRKIATMLAGDLARAGWTIVSGMARGIDGAAHEAALKANGKTIAVLAGGTDVIYPPEHAVLHARIAETGVVISEAPPGAEPTASAFPRRNRMISGLARGVLVVEASLRSGSLITARLGAEQGRDVLAVPGSPLDPRAQGPNSLIRDGAALVERVEDILAVLGGGVGEISNLRKQIQTIPQVIENNNVLDSDSVRRRVEEALGPGPTAVDEVVRQCQVSPALVATALLELELAGRLERHPGNRVALIGTN